MDLSIQQLQVRGSRLCSEHLVGILALLMQSCQLGHHLRTVLGIGDTKPFAGGIQHLAGSLALLDEGVHHQRNEELTLEVRLILGIGEELTEVCFAVCKVIGSESPEIHTYRSGVGNAHPLFVLVQILYGITMTLNLGALYDAGEQVALLVILTYSTAYGTALGEGVAHAEAHHCILACTAFGQVCQELTHHAECITVIEVVTVEHGKWLLDNLLAHQNSVVGAPGLGASLGNSKALG